jgi:hypothetical protein
MLHPVHMKDQFWMNVSTISIKPEDFVNSVHGLFSLYRLLEISIGGPSTPQDKDSS